MFLPFNFLLFLLNDGGEPYAHCHKKEILAKILKKKLVDVFVLIFED